MLADQAPPQRWDGSSAATAAWTQRGGSASTAPTQVPLPPATAAGGASDSALLAATVRLRVADPNGRSCGTGTIIDSRSGEALILTCGHIFRDSQGKGQITVDLFSGNAPQTIPGRLLSYDVNQDVGLVAIRTPAPVAVARVAPLGYRIDPGVPVVSVGCNNGDPPTARHSQVTALDKFEGPANLSGPSNLEVTGQPVEGRSGGGLFSREGYVIGVCNAADPSDKEGVFAGLGSIYAELDRSRLAFVYKSPSGSPTVLSEAAGPTALAIANTVPPAPPRMPTDARPGLAAHEQAAFDEIQRHLKEGAEVVCVIRSRENPNAKSEVIMLDHASPEFIKALP